MRQVFGVERREAWRGGELRCGVKCDTVVQMIERDDDE